MFRFIKNKKIIIFAVFVSVLIPLSNILATIQLRMQTNWPRSPLGAGLDVGSTITDLVQYIYEWGIFLGGLAVFIAFLIAGFQYLTSVGNPTLMKESWDRIKSALFGLILLLSSWLILHTINPELTILREIKFDPAAVPTVDLVEGELLAQPKPCVEAILFRGPNFTEESRIMKPGARKGIGEINFEPRSFKFCRVREKINEKEEERHPEDKCGEGLIEGGACTLQLYDGGWFFGLGCGGPVVELAGPRIADIANIMAVETVKCVELVSIVPIPAPPTPPTTPRTPPARRTPR